MTWKLIWVYKLYLQFTEKNVLKSQSREVYWYANFVQFCQVVLNLFA